MACIENKSGWSHKLRIPEVFFYVNILQCFFVVEHFTANAVSIMQQIMASMNYLLNRIFLLHTIVVETNAKQVDKFGADTSHDIIVEVSVPILKKRIS